MARPVVFDLDQTLIRGEAVDWAGWTAAIEIALGVPLPADEDWSSHPVHTDHGLLDSLSRKLRGRPFGEDERPAFEADVIARIDAVIASSAGAFTAIAGASAALAALAGRAALATGNIHPVTERKLRASGLPRLPCSCSAAGLDRAGLVARGLARLGWAPGDDAVSFGDGVWDVRAARVLGVGFVGVAQSDAHEERLRSAGARHVLRDYVDLPVVLALVEAAEPPGEEAAARVWGTPRE